MPPVDPWAPRPPLQDIRDNLQTFFPGQDGTFTGRWLQGELIARGNRGRVYVARNSTTGNVATVKQVAIQANEEAEALKRQIQLLKDLGGHSHIVQCLGFEEVSSTLHIFFEYVPGGTIASALLKNGDQIMHGIEYLHSQGIIHHNLKPHNILVDNSGVCKISGFGLSTLAWHGVVTSTAMRSIYWMAPEMIQMQPRAQQTSYDFKVDIWNVGCIVLEMWTGLRPWFGEEAFAVMFKLHLSNAPALAPEVELSAMADDFRLKSFKINPQERPTAVELRQHPYLTILPGWTFPGFD